MRAPARRFLPVSALLLFTSSLAGDPFFRLADPGPVAANVVTILGDSSRTLAFEATGVFERRGERWVRLELTAGPGVPALPAGDSVRFVAGRFFATAWEGSTTCRLLRLDGQRWSLVAAISDGHPGIGSLPTFAGNHFFVLAGPSEAPRLVAVDLARGESAESAVPSGAWGLLVLGEKLFLAQQASFNTQPTLVYQREGDLWTRLDGIRAPKGTLYSTPSALFGLRDGRVERLGADLVLRDLGGGFPQTGKYGVPLCSCSFREWKGRELFTTGRDDDGVLMELSGDRFVPFEPRLPFPLGVRPFVVGDELLATDGALALHRFAAGRWEEIAAPEGAAGASAYAEGSDGALVAQRGRGLWLRESSGWRRLPSPGDPRFVFEGIVLGARAVVRSAVARGTWGHLEVFDPDRGVWVRQDLPQSFLPGPRAFSPHFVVDGTDLWAAADTSALHRLREGSWETFLAADYGLPGVNSFLNSLSVVQGVPYLLGQASVLRLDGGALVRVFEHLPHDRSYYDVIGMGDDLFLLSTTGWGPPYTVLFKVHGQEVTPLLDARDLDGGPSGPLWTLGGELGAWRHRLTAEGPREVRTERPLYSVDRAGRFALGWNDGVVPGPSGLLCVLRPVPRVVRNVAASVDVTGFARYRTELVLGNLSARATPVTIVRPADHVTVARLVLAPGEQRTVLDPAPGYVGPLSISFDALADDREAFAAARVFSPAGDGFASTTVPVTPAGSFTGSASLLPPSFVAGGRLSLALAAAGDGGRTSCRVFRYGSTYPPPALVPAGGFLQLALAEGDLGRELVVDTQRSNRGRWPGDREDDLLGYVVRNDEVTNDGTVVPFESPDPLADRHIRFLPAVVSLESPYARYRTELSLAVTYGIDEPIHVRYQPAHARGGPEGSFTIPLSAGYPLRIPDVGPWLAAHGVLVAPDAVDGSLTFTADGVDGAAWLLVTAVVLARAPGAEGDYGTTVPVWNEGRWARTRAVVPGLVEDAEARTNLAAANAEPAGGPEATVQVVLHRAADGAIAARLPEVTLMPGERVQWNGVLAQAGMGGAAWAEVVKTRGAGRFVAYGVRNDRATGDGTVLPMVAAR